RRLDSAPAMTEPHDTLIAPSGWRPLDAHPVGAVIAQYATRSFVANDPTGDRPRVRYAVRELLRAESSPATAAAPAAPLGSAVFVLLASRHAFAGGGA